jgi:LEA14-like dessication related protein
MSYRDPYTDAGRHQPQHGPGDYNPYPTAPQRQHTYDEGSIGPGYDAYTDEAAPRVARFAGPQSQHSVSDEANKESTFQHHEPYLPAVPKEHTPRALRKYRYESQGLLWTKGGRGRCICRFCCCTGLIGLFLLISIFLSLVLWIRPPDVNFGTVSSSTSTGSAIQLQTDGLTINLGVNVTVDNPNYFSVDFKKIEADIFYPINNTAIGTGSANNVNIAANSQTNFTFPFSIDYKRSLDPSNKILIDLATKCGFIGTATDISVNYKITLGIRIIFVTISPTISNTFTFACPLTESDISGLMSSAGVSAL